MRVLDLCAGRLGISRVFAARGHQVTAVDLVEPPDIPAGVTFIKADILSIRSNFRGRFSIAEFDDHGPILWEESFDFAWASTPCEEFSVHGMKHFHPNPKYPAMGLKLFNHAREILTEAGIPFVMENVKPAQDFVGRAVGHCGPFFLWGNSVPLLFPGGISKSKWFKRPGHPGNTCEESLKGKRERKAKLSTIPPELANVIADYAERILEAPA